MMQDHKEVFCEDNNDLIPWLPCAALAISDGAVYGKDAGKSIAAALTKRWPSTQWSLPMMQQACSMLLEKRGFVPLLKPATV